MGTTDTVTQNAKAATLSNKSIAADANTLTGLTDVGTNNFRLTLTTNVPVTITDVVAATVLYLTPYHGGSIALYDGTRWVVRISAQISITPSGIASGSLYDVFAQWSGSAVALSLSNAWTNDTTRADAIALQDGNPVLSSDHTKRLVGTICGTGVGQMEDSLSKRYVSNLENTVLRPMKVTDSTDTWTYVNPNAVWRQVRASANNKFSYVACEQGKSVQARVNGTGSAGGSANTMANGVGIDSTTVQSAQVAGSVASALGESVPLIADYFANSALGRHDVNWLETGVSNGVTYTFIGDNGTTIIQSGMAGYVEG